MVGRIYIIQNKVSNKVYIGATTQKLNDRFTSHKTNKSQTRSKIIFEEDPICVSICLLEECDEEIMDERELFYIQKYKLNCVNSYGTGVDGLLKCDKCGEDIQERGFSSHYKACGLEHVCECGAKLSTNSKLERHKLESCKLKAKTMHKCEKCPYETSTKDNLKRHIKNCRLNCNYCDLVFADNKLRQNHEQNYHNNPSTKKALNKK